MDGWRGTIWDGSEVNRFKGQAGGRPIRSEEQRSSNHLERTSKPHSLLMFFFYLHYYYFWAAHQEQYSQFFSLNSDLRLSSGFKCCRKRQAARLSCDCFNPSDRSQTSRRSLYWNWSQSDCHIPEDVKFVLRIDPPSTQGAKGSSDAAPRNHWIITHNPAVSDNLPLHHWAGIEMRSTCLGLRGI